MGLISSADEWSRPSSLSPALDLNNQLWFHHFCLYASQTTHSMCYTLFIYSVVCKRMMLLQLFMHWFHICVKFWWLFLVKIKICKSFILFYILCFFFWSMQKQVVYMFICKRQALEHSPDHMLTAIMWASVWCNGSKVTEMLAGHAPLSPR